MPRQTGLRVVREETMVAGPAVGGEAIPEEGLGADGRDGGVVCVAVLLLVGISKG